jgi:hypothetical protein
VLPGGSKQLLTTSVVAPGGLAVGPDNALYVSTMCVLRNTGEGRENRALIP